MAQGKRTAKKTVDAIALMARLGYSSNEIQQRLEEKAGVEDTVPDIRTIQRYAKDFRGIAQPWRRTDFDGAETRLVLDVLKDLIVSPLGHKGSLTEDEARWVLWVRRAAPELRPNLVWLLASLYLVRETRNEADLSDLDGYLAFQPWRDRDAFKNYMFAARDGKVPLPQGWGVFIDLPLFTNDVSPDVAEWFEGLLLTNLVSDFVREGLSDEIRQFTGLDMESIKERWDLKDDTRQD